MLDYRATIPTITPLPVGYRPVTVTLENPPNLRGGYKAAINPILPPFVTRYINVYNT